MDRMNCYRLTRSKLGFRSMDMPEFHIMMEFDNMQQLDDAMTSHHKKMKNTCRIESHSDLETIQHCLIKRLSG